MTQQTRRRRVALCCLLTVTAMTVPTAISARAVVATPDVPGATSHRTSPPVLLPPHPDGLPAPQPLTGAVDAAAGYQPQLACLATAMPGTIKLRALALKTYGHGDSSPATPRACTSGGSSEHKDGRAWDWMLNYGTPADRRVAADFLSWLVRPSPTGQPGEMASRLGVMYVIYNRKIWSSYAPGWRTYTGYDPHTSHIHISLSWNGARAHTSFWTGRLWASDFGACQYFQDQPAAVPSPRPRTTPCPAQATAPFTSSRQLAWLGSSGADVALAQGLMGTRKTSSFDAATRRSVLRYQRHHELPRTGALDGSTWASLLPSSAERHVPRWTPARAALFGRNTGYPALRRSSAGRAVYALQTALRLPANRRTGFFAGVTRSAVIAFKADHGLPPNGAVTRDVWTALPAP